MATGPLRFQNADPPSWEVHPLCTVVSDAAYLTGLLHYCGLFEFVDPVPFHPAYEVSFAQYPNSQLLPPQKLLARALAAMAMCHDLLTAPPLKWSTSSEPPICSNLRLPGRVVCAQRRVPSRHRCRQAGCATRRRIDHGDDVFFSPSSIFLATYSVLYVPCHRRAGNISLAAICASIGNTLHNHFEVSSHWTDVILGLKVYCPHKCFRPLHHLLLFRHRRTAPCYDSYCEHECKQQFIQQPGGQTP